MAANTRAFICLMLCGLSIFVEGGCKKGTPALLLEFATILAGQYRNYVPTTTGATFDFLYVPVVVPALGDAVTFYFENRALVDGEFQRSFQQIYAYTLETPTKIRQAGYDIANPERFGTERKQLKALANLELSELSNRPQCDAFYEKIDEVVYMLTLATDECTVIFGGEEVRPIATRNLTCSEFILSGSLIRVSDGEVVSEFTEPAVLEKISVPFKVPVRVFRRNQCFDVPCKGKKPRRKNLPVWGDIRKRLGF